jgi:prepilin-type N-terminal cleavage/methylation domain-containing protein/prepilin-type processing-associated H-X9-DG protein
MNKRAFTLIELLVVIAIIAILAAILFPVFAQAKLSAKKSASLSNIKQVTLANLMYENDYDDYFVIASQNFYEDACGIPGYTGDHCLVPQSTPALDWPLLLQPYIKSLGLYVDPGTGDPQGYFSGPNAYAGHQNSHAQYGYNFLFLAPIAILNDATGGWLPSSYGVQFQGLARSQTQAVRPGDTVMFTSAEGSPEDFTSGTLVAGKQFGTPDYSFLTDPGVGYCEYWATNRLTFVFTDSKVGLWASEWVKNTPIGELTGDTRALSPYQGANVGFVDGHSKSMTADALAAGTDFGTSTTTSGGGIGSVVTDVTKFMWTLDGTLHDAGQSSQCPNQ